MFMGVRVLMLVFAVGVFLGMRVPFVLVRVGMVAMLVSSWSCVWVAPS